MNTDYNGWTNYATWRINLELISDDESWSEWAIENRDRNEGDVDANQLADMLQENVEELVCDGRTADTLAAQYAMAFLNNVNWNEIAEGIIRDLPEYEPAEDDE